MNGKVVVITGASEGIGAALAAEAGRRGMRPVLVARREGPLREAAAAAGPEALAVVADATDRADVERVLAEAVARFGGVDVWVNNVGRGISRNVMDLTDADVDEMVQVNLKSALYGMQTAVRHFQARGGRGQVVNVSSMLGRVPYVPIRSAYSAMKHALNALSANLRMELRAQWPEIHVTTVLPGVVATRFGVNAVGGGPDSRQMPGAQTAEEVAAIIADAIERPRADVYTRPEFRQRAAEYYGAEDMAAVEAKFGGPPR
jgi:NAD(P)-dependent dehydrogenase (short-subunit alcohol dehydrogenase family)